VKPLVSVITPTWGRHGWLLNRCIPSVQAQTWPNVEHIIVSDGPDVALREKIGQLSVPVLAPLIRFFDLPVHATEKHWGNPCRRKALEMAQGELITYIDDDDRLYPKHCELLAREFVADATLMWAYSQMLSHGTHSDIVLGTVPPAEGTIGTPMVMHRRELLDVATWGEDSDVEDWKLISAWLASGVPHKNIQAITSEVWPSICHGNYDPPERAEVYAGD